MWFSVAWQKANLTTKNYWFFLNELNELPGGWAVPVGYSTKDVFRVPNLGNPFLFLRTFVLVCVWFDVLLRMWVYINRTVTTCIRNTHENCPTRTPLPLSSALHAHSVFNECDQDSTASLLFSKNSRSSENRCAKFKVKIWELVFSQFFLPRYIQQLIEPGGKWIFIGGCAPVEWKGGGHE